MNSLIRAAERYAAPVERLIRVEACRVIVVTGPTGVGKNTAVEYLGALEEFHLLVSHTTRAPRMKDGAMEVDGVDYHFVDSSQMLALLEDGRMLEAEVVHRSQVSGVSLQELEEVLHATRHAVCEIDPKGAVNLERLLPSTSVVALIPPSLDEWLRRLVVRGGLNETDIFKRLETAQDELATIEERGWPVVVNGDRDALEEDLMTLVNGTDARSPTSLEVLQSLRRSLKTPGTVRNAVTRWRNHLSGS